MTYEIVHIKFIRASFIHYSNFILILFQKNVKEKREIERNQLNYLRDFELDFVIVFRNRLIKNFFAAEGICCAGQKSFLPFIGPFITLFDLVLMFFDWFGLDLFYFIGCLTHKIECLMDWNFSSLVIVLVISLYHIQMVCSSLNFSFSTTFFIYQK